MVKEIFGDFASWRHKKEENDRLREANFKKMAEPGTYEAQLNYHPQAADRRAGLPDVLRPRPGHGPTEVRDADRLRREHERHRRPADRDRRRQGDRQVSGPAAKPVRALFALSERRLSRHGHRPHHADHGPVADLRLARQPAAGPRRAVPVVRRRAGADQHAPGQRQRHGPGHAARLRAAVLPERPRAEAGRGGGHLGGDLSRRAAAGRQGMARARHGRLRRRLRDRHRRLDRRRQLLLRPDARDQRRRRGHRVPDVARRQGRPGGRSAPSAKLTDQEWAKVQELPWDWDILRFQRLNHVLAALPGKVPGTVQQPAHANRLPSVSARSPTTNWIGSSGRRAAAQVA